MSSIIHNEKRDIFPIWRKYKDALKLGELDPLAQKKATDFIGKVEKELDYRTVEEWKKKRTIGLAADILNFGTLHHQNDTKIFKEAATFILKNQDISGISLISLAKKSMDQANDEEIEEVILTPKQYHINDLVFSEIARLKKMISREPKFAVGWIELARNYVVLAQIEKAKRCIQTALHIAPNSRFILRSASRFFVHIKEFDQALSILVKSSIASTDPWVLSAVLALSRKIQKRTNHISKGRRILSDEKFSFYETSELNSALATIELFQGGYKGARKLFQNALISPNDNALAQAIWYSEIDFPVGPEKLTFLNTAYEAETLQNYKKGDIKESYKQNMDWISEEPFSVRPVLTASYHALVFLEDYDESINVTELGLKTNPTDLALKNNLLYSHIMKNDLTKAKTILDSLDETGLSGHLEATKGLYFFRLGQIEEGRKLYKSAIEGFRKQKNSYLESLAYLNYAREEIMARTEIVPSIMAKVEKKYNDMPQQDVQFLYSKITELYEPSK